MAECALLGREAEMPGFQVGEYDLAGFCVGIVKRASSGWLSGTGGRRRHWLGKSGRPQQWL